MKNDLIEKIDLAIEEAQEDLIQDTIKLVNIKSVKSTALPGAPFGEGVRKVLDTVMDMGQRDGFYITDYNVGVVSVALKKGQPDLGIWTHGDVVGEGDGWIYEPYNARKYKDCIIGRGVTDNKGQLAAIFQLFKIFKKLGIELNYNPALYVGSNEETGKKDILGIPGNEDAKGFIHVCTPPRLSLVPDGSFPVGYGGNGSVSMTFRSKTPLHGFTLTAGQAETPGLAVAVFDGGEFPDTLEDCLITKGEKIIITADSPPRHGAEPDENGNMITLLTKALLKNHLIVEEDRYILEFLYNVSLDIHGSMLHIDTKAEPPLVLFSRVIHFVDGYPELVVHIGYPPGITCEEIVQRMTEVADENGFVVSSVVRNRDAYMLDTDWEVINRLNEISNQVTGENKPPYIMCGGTYAHVLPNALVYGTDGNKIPVDFPAGHGGAHGRDEVVSVERLKRAMRIYARALLELNEMEW